MAQFIDLEGLKTYHGKIKEYIGGARVASATYADKLGEATVGTTYEPIYLNNGVATTCSKYAGGTAVTLNDVSKAESDVSFYAPTTKQAGVVYSDGTNNPSFIQSIDALGFRVDGYWPLPTYGASTYGGADEYEPTYLTTNGGGDFLTSITNLDKALAEASAKIDVLEGNVSGVTGKSLVKVVTSTEQIILDESSMNTIYLVASTNTTDNDIFTEYIVVLHGGAYKLEKIGEWRGSIPTATSQLTNDSDFVTSNDLDSYVPTTKLNDFAGEIKDDNIPVYQAGCLSLKGVKLMLVTGEPSWSFVDDADQKIITDANYTFASREWVNSTITSVPVTSIEALFS